MKSQILQIGAEAEIILGTDSKTITKRRVKKSYRLASIDEKIRKLRTRSEGKLMERASKLISIPNIKKVDEKKKEIVMDFIQGKRLSESLDSFDLKKQKEICRAIGESIAKLHDSGIIHGDLTTSNMILVEEKKIDSKKTVNRRKLSELTNDFGVVGGNGFKIFFIDFGLGFISIKPEDKAVDLHLLRQALEAKHFKQWVQLFDEVKKGYTKSKQHKVVLEQFKKVEARGRYKESY